MSCLCQTITCSSNQWCSRAGACRVETPPCAACANCQGRWHRPPPPLSCPLLCTAAVLTVLRRKKGGFSRQQDVAVHPSGTNEKNIIPSGVCARFPWCRQIPVTLTSFALSLHLLGNSWPPQSGGPEFFVPCVPCLLGIRVSCQITGNRHHFHVFL